MDPKRLYLEFQHAHLPLLADGGYVTWEEEPLCVERGPNFEEAAVVFRSLQAHADEIPGRLVHGCRRLEENADETG